MHIILFFYTIFSPVDVFSVLGRDREETRPCSTGLKKLLILKDKNHKCLHLRKRKKKYLKMDAVSIEDSTLNFPFLSHSYSIRHITRGKYLFVLRGLPGSGKSTIARKLQTVYPKSIVCSADDHFLVNGVYVFDISGLKDAHAACQAKAKQACESGVTVVIIDNTNVRRWEMKYYFDLADHSNYTAIVVETKTAWRFDPVELSKRNKHGVTEDILGQKALQFERLSPVYYGWFLTEQRSREVAFVAKSLFNECLKKCPEYHQTLLNNLSFARKERDPEHGDSSVSDYFNWRKIRDLLHSTAKFCNKGRAVGAHDYMNRRHVQDTVGTASDLTIVGFSFSRHTVGARLQLTDDQLALFDKPEERERDDIQARTAAVEARVAKMNLTKNHGRSVKDVDSTQKVEPTLSGNKDGVKTIPPPCGFGRSAHITICCAERVKPSQTIYDSLDVCDLEQSQRRPKPVPVTWGEAAYLGDGFCVVYLYRPITVRSLYSAFHV